MYGKKSKFRVDKCNATDLIPEKPGAGRIRPPPQGGLRSVGKLVLMTEHVSKKSVPGGGQIPEVLQSWLS